MMRNYLLAIIFLMSGFVWSETDLSTNDIEQLKGSVGVNSVRTDSIRDDDRNKVVRVRFSSYQDEMDKTELSMRVTLELIDRDDNNVSVQFMRKQGDVSTEYVGEDVWEFYVPYGEFRNLDVSGYAIQYGVMNGDVFVPIASQLDNAETAEEILSRSPERIETAPVLKHAFLYREEPDSEDYLEASMKVLTE